VLTILGEETWVNSRWVSVPESDGGGLAEREFLFREVGLERWLDGLDLEGKDVVSRNAIIERRKQKLAKKMERKKKQAEIKKNPIGSDSSAGEEPESILPKARKERDGVLRYGDDKSAPLEALSDDDMSSDSSGDEHVPQTEAQGQIKVALYRVLASGEIKRGEYSPQFDAHDDDDMENGSKEGNAADVDHTTSFAKPKTLDPKSITTQTVTGIDPPEKPYAVFTFFYRGERKYFFFHSSSFKH